jgi:hypothetical protein
MTSVTNLFFTVKGCYPHTQPPSWRTSPCQLSVAAYSMYLQLTFIARGHPSIRGPSTHHAVVTGTHLTWYNIAHSTKIDLCRTAL